MKDREKESKRDIGKGESRESIKTKNKRVRDCRKM
jgi:hypothetical protein